MDALHRQMASQGAFLPVWTGRQCDSASSGFFQSLPARLPTPCLLEAASLAVVLWKRLWYSAVEASRRMMSRWKATSLLVRSMMCKLPTIHCTSLKEAYIWHSLPVACTPCALSG